MVGAGGLGAPCLLYLAAAGVGRLRVIDDDRVALSNLQRQVLYGTADVGRGKAGAAADALARLNPDVVVEAVTARLDAANAAALLAGADVIADCTDSFATRGHVAAAAYACRVPLVSAAIGPWDGQLGVFRGWEGGPCWRCFAGTAVDRPGETCADQGVVGALGGVMGSLQALEVIRSLVPFGESLAGRLLLLDALTMRSRVVRIAKDPACPLCASWPAGPAAPG